MLQDKSVLKKLRKKSDDVNMPHVHWLTTSRTSSEFGVFILPKVPVLRQSKVIFKDSFVVPKWTARIASKGTMNSGQNGIACKIGNRFWRVKDGSENTSIIKK